MHRGCEDGNGLRGFTECLPQVVDHTLADGAVEQRREEQQRSTIAHRHGGTRETLGRAAWPRSESRHILAIMSFAIDFW